VSADPAYLRIAAGLRERIVSGELSPGSRVPTEVRLMAEHGVSRTVAKWAISVLKGEGLVEGRRGSGVYVRSPRRLTREAHGRGLRATGAPSSPPGTSPPGTSPPGTSPPGASPPGASPPARDDARAGRRGTWEHHSEHAVADERVAARLAIEPSAPVMRTAYRFLADGEPIQLSTSWEPLGITGGTPVEWPEAGAARLVGVVARMDTIGIRVDEFVERVTARPARTAEREALGLPARGGQLLAVERTYLAGGVPVETADIVFPGDRYELVYRVPVD
jgi:GntR family transcriptional regulator